MNRFQSSTPRVALGIAAVAMTVVTFGLLVIVPATIDGSEDVRTQAAAKLVTPAATEVVVIPTRLDVLGVREMELASAPVDNVQPRKQAG
jgi:3-polyprenyl-4-hydroxybenzoate decarboxylase